MSGTNPIITSTDPRITEDDRALARRIIEFVEYDAGNHPMHRDHYWIVAAKIAQYRREQCCRAAGIMGDDPAGIENLVWFHHGGEDHGCLAETWKDRVQEVVQDYEEVLADHRRLVREIDVMINGEEGAAEQASLCDIASQLGTMADDIAEANRLVAEKEEVEEKLNQLNLEMARIAEEEKVKREERKIP